MKENELTAAEKADELIKIVLASQPNLINLQLPGTGDGKSVGDFIAALRDRLIDMYNLKP